MRRELDHAARITRDAQNRAKHPEDWFTSNAYDVVDFAKEERGVRSIRDCALDMHTYASDPNRYVRLSVAIPLLETLAERLK